MTCLHRWMVTFVALLWLSAPASASNGDQEMQQAARLHRAGDTAAAVMIWTRWANKGDPNAAYNLAVIHQHGDGVARNLGEALRWYRRAADAGDKAAQLQIGLMYQNGEGVKMDAVEAHRWFTADRQHHLHHEHAPQRLVWRAQAAQLIAKRDAAEAARVALVDSARVLVDLKRRAGIQETRPTRLAAHIPVMP